MVVGRKVGGKGRRSVRRQRKKKERESEGFARVGEKRGVRRIEDNRRHSVP